ncbi:MAG: HAD family hydrolase [Alphaproteobacteria bacterium]|nr:HAD family hydrolase [Alphaproteobacteria bacterium]
MSFSLALVIFDCDGVLIDSEGLAHQALVETLRDYGIDMTLEDALNRYMGVSSVDETADIEMRYNVKMPADYLDKKGMRRHALYEKALKATPGIFDMIDALPWKKCVASSTKPEGLRHSLGLTGLWGKLAPHIFSASQVERGKPAPDLFLFAAAQMNTAPEHCLVIEDSPAGVQAARAAHMRVWGFTGGSHCPPGHGDRLLQDGAEKVFARMDDLARALLPEAA